MADLGTPGRTVEGFLAAYPRARSSRPGVQRTIDGRTVFVTGDAPEATVDAVADSIEPVSAAEWRAFEQRV